MGVTITHLPGSGFSMRSVNARDLMPLCGYLKINMPFYIHNDGSLCCLFRINSIEDNAFQAIVSAIPNRGAIQFYKILSTEINIFGFIKIPIQYTFSHKKPIMNLLTGTKRDINEINRITIEEAKALYTLLDTSGMAIESIEQSPIYDYLTDDITQDKLCNLSYIKSGERRISSLISFVQYTGINGIDTIVSDKKSPVLLYCSVMKPDDKQLKKYNEYYQRVELIRSGREDKEESIMYFINNSLLLTSDRSSTLNEKIEMIKDHFNKQEIPMYLHSISAYNQYISMYPGNSNYAEVCKLVIQNNINTVVKALFG